MKNLAISKTNFGLMRTSITFITSFLVATSVLQAKAPQFELQNDRLTITPGGTTELYINTYIPDKNHIYLDHIGPSFNILTSFSTTSEGWIIEAKRLPAGEKYEQDLILRGKGRDVIAGRYTLAVYETKGREAASKPQTVEIVIRTQMCNSKTNICYRPKTIKKSLQVQITGSRKNISTKKFRSLGSAGTNSVEWILDYSEAFAKAKSTGQHVFVVITAPSWCGYCKVLDRNVFSKEQVAKTLNSKFIPLRILDTNPDNEKFQYSGYPTMFLYDSKGAMVKEVYNRKQQPFLSELAEYERQAGTSSNEEPSSNETMTYSRSMSGKFVREGKEWFRIEKDEKVAYSEDSRDENYIILIEKESGQFIALPIAGGTGYKFVDGQWVEAFRFQ